MHAVLPYVIVTAVAVLVMNVAEAHGHRLGVWLSKPIAATAFVVAALSQGVPETGYGRWVVVALALSWWGDVLLIPKSQRVFLAGILAFLSAHLAYGVAFAVRGLSLGWTLAAAAALALPAIGLGKYFVARAPAQLKGAVFAYVGVLSGMVALALGAYGRGGDARIPIAAIAFYFSDVSVALNRFVKPSPFHRAWGTPLYFGAQLVFAATALR